MVSPVRVRDSPSWAKGKVIGVEDVVRQVHQVAQAKQYRDSAALVKRKLLDAARVLSIDAAAPQRRSPPFPSFASLLRQQICASGKSCLSSLQAEPIAAEVTATAIGYLERLFGRRGRPGIRMAADALRFAMPEERVTAISTQYTAALVGAVKDAG